MTRTFILSPLDGCLIVDSTGTVLDASTCYIVDVETMTETVCQHFLQDATDSETFAIAKQWGRKLSDVVIKTPKLPGEL